MKNQYNSKDKNDMAGRAKCPCCGALNAFVRYEHVKTKEQLPAYVGSCIRPNCGHKYNAKQFFVDRNGFCDKKSFYTEKDTT